MSTSSLGELLAEEGFKKPKRRPSRRLRPASLPPRSDSMPAPSRARDDDRQPRASCSDNRRRSLSDDTHRPIIPSSSYRNEDLRKSLMKRRQLSLGESLKEISITSSSDIDVDDSCVVPIKKEAAPVIIKSVVSVLNSYVERFFEDERFRTSTYHRCASCCFQSHGEDAGPMGVLKRAIRTVERVAEGRTSPLYLKKASLQMSVVASLDAAGPKGGHSTLGVPNSHLAACAHLYLAVAHKFRGRDAVSAKHLLHVFSGCPHAARKVLLPELWDRIFLARLSHLMEWYFKQEESTAGGRGRAKKLALVEEAYNKSLDVGTSRLAAYYKECLEGRGEAPELPSIPVPDHESFSECSGEVSSSFGSDAGSPRMSTSSGYKAMVSRELYESVLGVSKKKTDDNDDEEEEEEEEENENLEKYSLCSPEQLSFSDDDEWASRRTYSPHKLKDPLVNESKHRSMQSLPSFPLPSCARTRNLPPWPDV